jgi:hypothetical protein
MQPTHVRDKRNDTRREWVAPVRLEEIRTGRQIEARSANCSSAGIMVELNQPLWPGMELALIPGAESAASRMEMRRLDVRWCRMVPGGSGGSTYAAGLRFDGPFRRVRSGGNLRVIQGGAA